LSRLSREIAERWRQLPPHGIEFYRQVAREDKRRHDQVNRHLDDPSFGSPPRKRKQQGNPFYDGGAEGP
jgi:hypothetical protein